jgi:hypothetical protein
MRTLELVREQPQGLKKNSPGRVPARRTRGRRCSDFVPPSPAKTLLFVGAERQDELDDALRLSCRGHSVVVVNPRVTPAARRFVAGGGAFLQGRIDQLPAACGCYDVICENYPYPSGRHYVPPRTFALARLSRLARGGRWILVTEAVRYATLIKAVVDHDPELQGRFTATLSSLSLDEAPRSHYPAVDSRYRLIVERCW